MGGPPPDEASQPRGATQATACERRGKSALEHLGSKWGARMWEEVMVPDETQKGLARAGAWDVAIPCRRVPRPVWSEPRQRNPEDTAKTLRAHEPEVTTTAALETVRGGMLIPERRQIPYQLRG